MAYNIGIFRKKMDNNVDNLNEKSEKSGKRRKIAALLVGGVLLLCAIVGFFIYNNVISAVTMRIQRLVGTVNLFDEEGAEQSLREKMRLGAGQTVTTAGESLIMVSLDDTKLMTMEETSKAEIKARGKKLLFNLIEGNLFFNVTEKLSDNESFDITTQTMICGIRGTSAYVGRDSTSHEVLMVTDGLVHVIATNPVTKETTEIDVPAGQKITIYLDDEAEGDKTISIRMEPFREEDLPAMALDTIRKSKELMDRIAKATGFKPKKLMTLADLSSVKGVSMYGSAADSLRASGIDDAIPFMGDRSHEMVSSANSAVNIAKDDLPLEVAIIQGYRDVMDVGTSAGYDKDNLASLMNGTRSCMEDTFILVDKAGLKSIDRINAAVTISETLKVSAGRMSTSKLSTAEIGDVLDAEKKLLTTAVKESAASTSDGSKGSDVLASLGRISDHITGTVDEEMDKSSNGDETVVALLGVKGPLGEKSSAESLEEKTRNNTDIKNDTKTVADNNGAGSSNTGDAGTANRGGATSQELKAAKSAIVATDAGTGIVALADGTLFDPTYYAAANPDVVAKYGTSTEALLAEWIAEGKAQGRPPIAPVRQTASNPPAQSSSGGGSSHSENNDDSGSSNSSGGSGSSGNNSGNNGGSSPVNTGTYDLSTLQGTLSDGTPIALANGPSITIGGSTNIALPLRMTDSNDPQNSGDITALNQINWQAGAGGVTATDSNGNTASKNANGTYTFTPANGTSTTYPDTDYQSFANALNNANNTVHIPNASGDFTVGNATIHYHSANNSVYVTAGSVSLPFTYRNDSGQDVEVNSVADISPAAGCSATATYNGTGVTVRGTNKGPEYYCSATGAYAGGYSDCTDNGNSVYLYTTDLTGQVSVSATIDKTTGAATFVGP